MDKLPLLDEERTEMAMTGESLVNLEEAVFRTVYGSWLSSVREASGRPRRKVAEYLDCEVSTVWRWETGKTLPDVFTHLRLLVYFSATLDARPDLKEWASRVYPTGFAPSLSA